MRESEHPDPKLGPLEAMSQTYFAGLDRFNGAYTPALKGLSRYQLEAAGLVARRAQAWLDIPNRLAACKTPQDLLGEQTKFWQTAVAQYTESWQRMGSALGMSASMLSGAFGGKAAETMRDIITFDEAADGKQEAGQKSGQRRAA